MSHVNAVRTLSQSRDPSPRAADEQHWEARSAAARKFLAGSTQSPIVLTQGAREVVLAQLERGDDDVDAREKCWKHVAVELDTFPEWSQIDSSCDESGPVCLAVEFEDPSSPPLVPEGAIVSPPPVPQLNMNFPASPGKSSTGPRSQSARSSAPHHETTTQGSISAREPLSPHASAEASANKESAPRVQSRPAAKLTMMERQALWMKAKNDALEAQRAEKEKENSNFSFKPDTLQSKRSFKAPAVQAALAATKPVVAKAPMVVEVPPKKLQSKGWATVKTKVKGGSVAATAKKNKVKNKPGKAKIIEALAGEPETENVPDDEEENVPDDEEEPEPEPEPKPEPEPFVKGSFWWRVEEGRGHHRVCDGSQFQMYSIFRKKDKTRGVDGVSLLVGRLEKPPYDERVIQMLFSVEHWTEEQAAKWWEENKHRYTGEADPETGRLMVQHKAVPIKQPAQGDAAAAEPAAGAAAVAH